MRKNREEETKIRAAKFRKSKEGKRNLSARFIPGKRFGHFGERAVEIIYELFEILALEDSSKYIFQQFPPKPSILNYTKLKFPQILNFEK